MLYAISNLNKQRKRDKGYRLLIKHLEIPAGAKIALTGPSGCGKSTTLDILGLALSPDSAEKFIFAPNEHTFNLAGLWKSGQTDALSRLRLNYLGYVLQTGELLPFLTAGENICLIPRINGQNSAKLKDKALKLAEQLGIAHLWNAMPETLSVGERQRVAIARALIAQPGVILADEPTAALDPMHARRVMDIFLQCIEEFGTALILATHDKKWALSGGFTEVPFVLQEDSTGVTAIIDSSS